MDMSTSACPFQGCRKFFKRKDRLDIHFRTHTGERPFVCDVDGCKSSYARQQHLTRHIKRSHTPDYKVQCKVRCSQCNLEFANTSCLKKHTVHFHDVQNGSNSYKCPEGGCNESFHKKKQLVVHQLQQHSAHLTHARKCYICPHEGCGRSFTFPNKLKHHMKIHQGYACDIEGCTIILPNWSSLRKHKAVDHAAIHSCSVCGAKFKQKSNWKQHIKIHSVSQKPHACPREKCGRLFLYKKNLTQHIKEFHDGETIWKNRPMKHPNKCNKKQRVFRKKSLAAQLCGFDDPGDQSQPQVIQIPQVSQVVSQVSNSVIQQLQQQQQHQLQVQAQPQQQQPTAQVYQQVINASGQLENIPIQLTPQQLQSLLLQLQSKMAGQQLVVQSHQQDPRVQLSQAQEVNLCMHPSDNSNGSPQRCTEISRYTATDSNDNLSTSDNVRDKENGVHNLNSCSQNETDLHFSEYSNCIQDPSYRIVNNNSKHGTVVEILTTSGSDGD